MRHGLLANPRPTVIAPECSDLSAFDGSAANSKNLNNLTACSHLASELRIRYFNAQSVCNKLPELHVLLLSGEVDIVCICESWLSDAYPDSLLSCAGAYQVVRTDRGSRGEVFCCFCAVAFPL